MALNPSTTGAIDAYWAERLGLGCDPADFERPGVSVCAADEGGIQLFRRNGSTVLGVPASLVDAIRERRSELDSLELDSDPIREWLSSDDDIEISDSDTVLGPAFYGYVDESTFTPVETVAAIDSGIRRLTDDDTDAFDRFRMVCPDEEWSAGGTELAPNRTIGAFADDRLVAVSDHECWDERIAHITIITHPEYRNRGYGHAAVSLTTEQALATDLLPQYRTLDAWPQSVALAEGLGYERWATSVFVRL